MSTTLPVVPSTGTAEGVPQSPNCQSLASHHRFLVRYAALAERYLFDDPSIAVLKVRQFPELLAQQACAYVGVCATPADNFIKVLNLLRDRRAAADVLDLFPGIRKAGNVIVVLSTDFRCWPLLACKGRTKPVGAQGANSPIPCWVGFLGPGTLAVG